MEKNKKDTKDLSADSRIKGEDFSKDEIANPDEQVDIAEAPIPDDEVTKLKADLEEQKDKYLRLAAEFENYKRRSSKERLPCVPVLSMPTTAHLRYQRCDQPLVMDQHFAQDAADASAAHHWASPSNTAAPLLSWEPPAPPPQNLGMLN